MTDLRWISCAAAALVLLMQAAAPRVLAGVDERVFDIMAYGAVGDGKTFDTKPINRAIDAAAAAGGGVVVLGQGAFLTGSIRLQCNITLRLQPGCRIVAAAFTPEAGYDDAEPNPAAGRFQDDGHAHWHNSLIWGENLHNVALEGTGVIDARQLTFRRKKQQTHVVDKAIAFKNCAAVRVSDITILHGGHFAVLATGVSDLRVAGVTIDTDRDGIDLDCCQHVRIERCAVNAPNDDGICLKSSWALGKAVPTQDVSVTDCWLSGFDCGTLVDGTRQRQIVYPKHDCPVGRIKLGTESAGGFSDIHIADCVFECTRGLALESVDGGTLERVSVERISMRHVTDSPIFIRLGSRLRRPNAFGLHSALRDVTIRDITATDIDARFPAIISGTDADRIERVTLERIQLQFAGGGNAVVPATQPATIDTLYPQPELFYNAPAYGLLARDVDGLTLTGLTITQIAPDVRPPIVMAHTTGVLCRDIHAAAAQGVAAFEPAMAGDVDPRRQ